MSKLPLYMRIGYFVLGQNSKSQPSVDQFLECPQLNPQSLPQEGKMDPRTEIPTTQSAMVWTSVGDGLPKYYEPVNIRVGNKVMDKLWARLSDGENDFYAVAGDPGDDNRVIRDITHWGWPVTPENVPGIVKLNLLVKLVEENYIPLEQILDFNREKSESFNQGIGRAVEVLEREIRRLRQLNPRIKNNL